MGLRLTPLTEHWSLRNSENQDTLEPCTPTISSELARRTTNGVEETRLLELGTRFQKKPVRDVPVADQVIRGNGNDSFQSDPGPSSPQETTQPIPSFFKPGLCACISGAVILFLLAVFVRDLPSPILSSQFASSSRQAFPSLDLVYAKFHYDDVYFALHHSTLPSRDEILFLLIKLAPKLSQGVRTTALSDSYVAVNLSSSIKNTASKDDCSRLLHIGPKIQIAQNYVREALDCLDASLALYGTALSRIKLEHADVQRALVNPKKDAGKYLYSFWDWSFKDPEEQMARYREKEGWLDALHNAVRLQDGKDIVRLKIKRYTRFEIDLERLQQIAKKAIGAEKTAEGSINIDPWCDVPEIKDSDALLLSTLLRVIGPSVEARNLAQSTAH